ncbi:hypothetical protein RZS08_37955, partial [Arthrospira platensis SPKY1]|nr:hypothetical protein [Arthrospira platensis SPKY1]
MLEFWCVGTVSIKGVSRWMDGAGGHWPPIGPDIPREVDQAARKQRACRVSSSAVLNFYRQSPSCVSIRS